MKKQIFASLGVMAVIIVGIGFIKFLQISAAIAESESRRPPPDAVTSVIVEEQVWPVTRSAVGTITAVRGAMLSTEEMGRVTEVNFDSGSEVEEGRVLLAMDTSVEEAQLEAAEARLQLSKLNQVRQITLRKKNANAQSDLDSALATRREADAEVARLKATIRRKKIIAPFSGQTGIRRVNIGQTLDPGTPVVSLQAFDPLYVEFTLPQNVLGGLNTGAKVEVRVDSLPDEVFEGTLTAIESAVDASTRTIGLQATISNSEKKLRPGMFVEAKIVYSEVLRRPIIPISSIKFAPYGDTVFVIAAPSAEAPDAPRALRIQIVRLGPTRGDLVAIESGLKPGEEIVSSGVFRLRPDSNVIVNNSVTPGSDLNPTPKDT